MGFFYFKKLLNAESSQKWEATGVEIDSRKVKKAIYFVQLMVLIIMDMIILTSLQRKEHLHA